MSLLMRIFYLQTLIADRAITHLPSVERSPEFVQKASSANSALERLRKDRTSGGHKNCDLALARYTWRAVKVYALADMRLT